MAIGIITWIAVGIIVTFVEITVMNWVRIKAFNDGMMKESKDWVDAVNKVQVPNWQSLPTRPGTNKEMAETAAKIYVEAFGIALGVVKEEIAMNRLEAMVEELKKTTE